MSEKEKSTAKELAEALSEVPKDAEDYVRGYLHGRIDANKSCKENIERS